MRLVRLDEELVDEHICERYIELASRAAALKQDLGILDSSARAVAVDIEPPATEKRRKKRAAPTVSDHRYYLEVSQSITSLHSSRDNDNSTTGFVLWSTTPFFLRWLLYDPDARPFRVGGDGTIPPLLSSSTAVFELGAGTSGVLPVVLGNYVGAYVSTDQRGLINGMKANIAHNLLNLNRRRCVSRSMGLHDAADEGDAKPTVKLEAMPLDWEKFQIPKLQVPFEIELAGNYSTVYIIAMDVIYNDYLIDPFLQTLSRLLTHFRDRGIDTHCLIGVHMRAQEVVSDFLSRAILEYDLPMHYVQCAAFEASRFSMYFI